MTVLTTFAANSSAADARDTLNQMLADIAALKDDNGGGTTPPPSGVLYDQTSKDSGYHDLGADGGTMDFVLNDAAFKAWFISDTDGVPGAYVEFSVNGRYNGKYNSATQSDQLIEAVLKAVEPCPASDLDTVFAADSTARQLAREWLSRR